MATIDNTSNTETTPTTPEAPTSQPSSNTTTTAPLFEARVVGKPNATVASIAAAISLFKGVLGASESNAADGTTTVQAFFFTEGDRSAFISSVSSGHVSAVAFAAAVADDPGNDDGDSGASLPTWAIAVIAVGGTLVVGMVIGLVYRNCAHHGHKYVDEWAQDTTPMANLEEGVLDQASINGLSHTHEH